MANTTEKKGSFTLEVVNPKTKKKYTCELKDPSFEETAMAVNLREKQGRLAAGDTLLKTLWISGDSEIKEIKEARLSAAIKIWGCVEVFEGDLKKN